MRVAYFVQTHRAPDQVLRLLATLRAGSPGALLLVGHDATGPPLDGRALAALGADLFHPAEPPRRGYWSLFAPWVEAVERLDRAGAAYDWLVYLSGQDYPVLPLAASEAALAAGGYDGYLTWVDAAAPSPDGRRRQGRLRYLYRYRDLPRAASLLGLLRRANGIQPWWHVHLTYGPRLGRRARRTPFGPQLRPRWGSQWTTLSRPAAERVAEAARGPLAEWFAATVCPDEAFAQTVLVGDPRFRLANDNLRFVDVRGSRDGHPRALGLADGPALLAGGYAFARKIDPAAEPDLRDWLDEHAPHTQPPAEAPARHHPCRPSPTMLYEKLDPAMQQTVDEFATRLADVPWAQRSEALAAAALPFAEQFEGPQATLAGKGFLTAVLERLGDEPVADPTQAVLLSLSLNPLHRQSADEWLAGHPEVAALVASALATELDGPEDEPDV